MSPQGLAPNSSFSLQVPQVQLGIDSTSLGEFKRCPRAYQLGILEQWSPRQTSVHLEFGIWLHGARERYDHARSKEATHQEALRGALAWVLGQTWNRALARPWLSDHKLKNRLTLVQTVVWYLDEIAQNDPARTIQLANGLPAVELSFQFDPGLRTPQGEAYTFCGHLDRIAELGGANYVVDIKTTGSTLGIGFFAQFTPGNQISMYSLAGAVAFETPVRGVVIDGIQVAQGFARFQRQVVPRSEAQLEDWLEDTSWWLGQMWTSATHSYWPMNDKSCHHYGGCQFLSVCSRPPRARQAWLEANFTRRVWDPLQRRGEPE